MANAKVDDLLLFSKVAEQKNFSRVADQLGMVKSMVSKRISRLESELGVQLLHRSTRRMSLTEAGETLYEYTARIQEEVTGAMDAIAASSDKPRGKLKVLSPISFGSYALSRVAGRFVREYEDINLELVLNSHSSDLISIGADVAMHIGEPADSSLMARKIGSRRLMVCASPAYFAEFGTPQSFQDLAQHNCLLHTRVPGANEWCFEDKGRELRVQVSGDFCSNSSHALRNAALADVGVVMLPDYTLQKEVEEGRLQAIFVDACPANINVYALFPYTKHVSPKLRVFLDYVVNAFK